jgi:hypothetical protein
MLPEDDRMIETCRSVLRILMTNFRLLKTIYAHLLVCYWNTVPSFSRSATWEVQIAILPRSYIILSKVLFSVADFYTSNYSSIRVYKIRVCLAIEEKKIYSSFSLNNQGQHHKIHVFFFLRDRQQFVTIICLKALTCTSHLWDKWFNFYVFPWMQTRWDPYVCIASCDSVDKIGLKMSDQ